VIAVKTIVNLYNSLPFTYIQNVVSS